MLAFLVPAMFITGIKQKATLSDRWSLGARSRRKSVLTVPESTQTDQGNSGEVDATKWGRCAETISVKLPDGAQGSNPRT